jgi:putative ABC transport system permease protein
MRIAIRQGRGLTAADGLAAPLVGVVNESFAREYFPDGGVVGSRIRWSRFEEVHWMTIVGVAGDVRHFGLDMPEQPAVYTPYAQSLQEWKRWQTVVLRAPGTEADLAAAIKREVWALDPQLSVTKVRTMDEVMGESFAERRFTMALRAIFAAVAIALAAMGIYGVMAFSVAQRTHEIGVRMALGARTVDLLRLVVGHGLALTLGGAAIGIAGAVALSRLMSSLLFGVTATDPATFAATAGLLIAVATAASVVPAVRAARTDPLRALRAE